MGVHKEKHRGAGRNCLYRDAEYNGKNQVQLWTRKSV